MPPDDARIEDARAWLARAELDLRAADLEMGTPEAGLWGDVAFHAQQAAEKALKAFLAWHDRPFRKTHSIEEIGRACTAIDPGLAELVDAAAPLTEFAWKFRHIRGMSATPRARRPDGRSWWRGSSSSP